MLLRLPLLLLLVPHCTTEQEQGEQGELEEQEGQDMEEAGDLEELMSRRLPPGESILVASSILPDIAAYRLNRSRGLWLTQSKYLRKSKILLDFSLCAYTIQHLEPKKRYW